MDSSVTLCADAVDQLDSAMGGLNDAVQELNDAISTSSDLLLSDLRAINNQFGKIIDVLRRQSDSTEETEESCWRTCPTRPPKPTRTPGASPTPRTRAPWRAT